jgi:lipopolysaccharide biosynthesis regulator YciM
VHFTRDDQQTLDKKANRLRRRYARTWGFLLEIVS